MRVLAIESSCDESAVAVLDSAGGLLAHELWSQIDLHRLYGGVVPELASRDHIKRLLPLVSAALARAATTPAQIDGVAYTAGPGLIGALLTGAALARSLAYAWGVPALGVHHLEGHLLAPLLEDEPPPYPHVALLVSGGHTMLMEVRGVGAYRLLGQTRDDAAGEAFDKTAKLLGLAYPGGPELARLAESGEAAKFAFPRPMINRADLEFSFSGLKTAVRLAVEARPHPERPMSPQYRADVARGVQDAIVATLVAKSLRALEQTGLETLVVSGGVGANRELRARLALEAGRRGARVYYPRIAFCTDNAAMIALAGLLRMQAGERDPLAVRAQAQWSIASLTPPGTAVAAPAPNPTAETVPNA
jgi:N6-L-threonylcarbamoyladenine synthase